MHRTKYDSAILSITLAVAAIYSLKYFPNGFFEDDAYFIFQIASNLVNTGIPTFDGYELTNGFHPLWVLLLSGIALPFRLLFESQSSQYYTNIFLILSAVLIYKQIQICEGTSYRILFVVMAIFCGFGMETTLVSYGLIQIYFKILNDKKNIFVYVFLVTATRWDAAVALLPLLFLDKFRRVEIYLAIFLGVAFTALYHTATTNEFYAISAYIKMHRAEANHGLSQVLVNISSLGNLYRYFVIFILNGIVVFFLYKNNNSKINITILISANTFVALHTVLSDMRDWYFAPTVFPLIFYTAYLLSKDNSRYKKYTSLLIYSVAGMGLMAHSAYIYINKDTMVASADFVKDIRALVPKNSRIYAYDGAGYLGWSLSDYVSITNGDGLVNSFNYYRTVFLTGNLESYLQLNKIDYYIINNRGRPSCIGLGFCLGSDEVSEIVSSRSQRPYAMFSIYKINKQQIMWPQY
jgi:hypothetical protein